MLFTAVDIPWAIFVGLPTLGMAGFCVYAAIKQHQLRNFAKQRTAIIGIVLFLLLFAWGLSGAYLPETWRSLFVALVCAFMATSMASRYINARRAAKPASLLLDPLSSLAWYFLAVSFLLDAVFGKTPFLTVFGVIATVGIVVTGAISLIDLIWHKATA